MKTFCKLGVADHITDRLWLPPCRGAGSARQRLRGYSADSPALSQPFNFSMSLCRVRRLDAPLPPQAAQHDAGKFYPLPSLPTLSKHFIFYSVSAFSFYLKKKTPAKEKQTQGFAPRPRERRAAVHSLCYSVGSSAHSPVNSLRSNSTVSCGLLCKPFPRISQITVPLRRGYWRLIPRNLSSRLLYLYTL